MLRKTWKAHNAFNHAHHAAVTAAAPPRALPCLHRLCLPGGTVSAPLAPCAYMLSRAYGHMIICAAATLPCACRCRCHGEPALHRTRSDAESPVGFILSPEVTPEAALPQAETEWDSSSNTTGQEPRVANRSTVSCKRHLLQHLMHWMSTVVLKETSLTADTCTDTRHVAVYRSPTD